MKDPELYDFFKKGSEGFDEMPPADLWNKIDAGLKENKKAKPVKTLLKILFVAAVVALIVWICFRLVQKNLPLENQLQNKRQIEVTKIPAKDTLTKHDSLKQLPTQKQVVESTSLRESNTTDPTKQETADEFNPVGTPETKTPEPVYKLQTTGQPTEEVATTTTFKNRIVVRTTKQLTDAQYELLIASAQEKNKDNYGLMLIIIAPGHPAYRKVIPGNKLDVKTTFKKIGMDTIATQNPKIIPTSQTYFDEILKNQQDLEVKPEFPGGMEAFYKYITKNFKTPRDTPLNGKIIIAFVVETDGSLSNIKVVKDMGYGTGAKAVKALKNSPKWKPGIQNGKPVRVQYSLPITINSQF